MASQVLVLLNVFLKRPQVLLCFFTFLPNSTIQVSEFSKRKVLVETTQVDFLLCVERIFVFASDEFTVNLVDRREDFNNYDGEDVNK